MWTYNDIGMPGQLRGAERGRVGWFGCGERHGIGWGKWNKTFLWPKAKALCLSLRNFLAPEVLLTWSLFLSFFFSFIFISWRLITLWSLISFEVLLFSLQSPVSRWRQAGLATQPCQKLAMSHPPYWGCSLLCNDVFLDCSLVLPQVGTISFIVIKYT